MGKDRLCGPILRPGQKDSPLTHDREKEQELTFLCVAFLVPVFGVYLSNSFNLDKSLTRDVLILFDK